jgi:DNA-directed RNA polymerase subunit E'
MYEIVERDEVVRIPPEKLGEDIETVAKEIAIKDMENKVKDKALTLVVLDVKPQGEAAILRGDPGIYQAVRVKSVIARPELQEVVEGYVCDILKFGAFVRFGPLEALVHISQIMDERVDFDPANQRLVGRNSKRELRIGDRVRARIVSLSLNDANPRESKIGLTMRQPGLGKPEWLELERKKVEKKKEAKK